MLGNQTSVGGCKDHLRNVRSTVTANPIRLVSLLIFILGD